MNRILRYEVPVDGDWHAISGHSTPVHVNCREQDVVEFWAWEREDLDLAPMEYTVIGTGHRVSGPCSYVGTALAPGGHLVWHLMRRS